MRLLLVLAGGGLGAALRYLTGLWIAGRFGGAFPWGTLAVNVTGSLLIGLVATLADERGSIGPETRTFLVAGVLGGFTTFSAFSLETLRLEEAQTPARAALYVLASVALSLAAVLVGAAAGRGLRL